MAKSMRLDGATLNQVLSLGASHALYRKTGNWYHQLKDFPGILFDEMGYLFVPTKDAYLKNDLLRKNQDLHIKNGISKIPGYVKFTQEQLKKIEPLKINLTRKRSVAHRHFKFVAANPVDIVAVLRKPKRISKPVEVKQIHRKICVGLYCVLSKEFGTENIGCDCPTGCGTYIDMVRKEGNSYHFYEIKTYNDIKTTIREAYGQLLEYAYWNFNPNVVELIIVSHKKPSSEVKKYISFLRKTFSIPLYYQYFDVENKVLFEKI